MNQQSLRLRAFAREIPHCDFLVVEFLKITLQWCSPRSLQIDTNHFCGRCPIRSEISAALRLCVRLLLPPRGAEIGNGFILESTQKNMLTGLFKNTSNAQACKHSEKTLHHKAVKHGTRSLNKTTEELTSPTTNSDGLQKKRHRKPSMPRF